MTVIDLHTLQAIESNCDSVLCLGNFDGIHIGHQALINETLRIRSELSLSRPGIKSGVWFFKKSPFEIISKKHLPHIIDFDSKLRTFAELGLDLAYIYEYEEIGNFSPEQFVENVLKKECGCVFAVCGYNFKFGKNASGDANTLSTLMGGNTSVVIRVTLDGKPVSSSEIRRLISEGDVETASFLLGRKYSITGKVLHGKQLGRKLGIPTINQIFSPNIAIPKKGIYISRTLINGNWIPSVSNIGFRPSVENSETMNCETYIIDFDGDLYGQEIEVEFFKRLRDEKKFDNIDALRWQIQQDIEKAKEYFK